MAFQTGGTKCIDGAPISHDELSVVRTVAKETHFEPEYRLTEANPVPLTGL